MLPEIKKKVMPMQMTNPDLKLWEIARTCRYWGGGAVGVALQILAKGDC